MANPQLNENRNQGGTLWNNPVSDNYKVESAAETGMNSWLDNLLDPTGLVSGFWNDITGITSQSREFAQQEYLQDKMNEYNDPANQMMRMRRAGINPNTAAAGIAGGGNESAQAPQVSSNTSGSAAGLGALASMIGAGFGAPAQLATAAAQSATAEKTSQLLPLEKNLLRAQTYEAMMNAGVSQETAIGLSIENYLKPDMLVADLATKLTNLDFLDSQIRLSDQMFKTEEKKIDLMQSEIDLNKETQSLVELQQATERVTTARLNLENQRLKWHMDFLKQNNIDLTLPSGSWYASVLFGSGTLAEKKAKIGNLLKISYYNDFNNSKAQSLGALQAQLKALEANNEFQKDLTRYGITAQGLKDLIFKYGLGTGFNTSVGVGPFKVGVHNEKP